MTEATVAVGCGGFVPEIDGPSHRYMLASPGCWAAYTSLIGGALMGIPLPEPYGSLMVDAYAVQHPGIPSPQATQSVWVHLITLRLALERGWPPARLVALRRMGADSADGWPWLEPPATMGPLTAIDVASASPDEAAGLVQAWIDGAWGAWAAHRDAIHQRAEALEARLG
jgi:Family of unknown function (DUF5946)